MSASILRLDASRADVRAKLRAEVESQLQQQMKTEVMDAVMRAKEQTTFELKRAFDAHVASLIADHTRALQQVSHESHDCACLRNGRSVSCVALYLRRN